MQRALSQWQPRINRAEESLADTFKFCNQQPAIVVVDANYWTFGDLAAEIPDDYYTEPASALQYQLAKIERHFENIPEDNYIPFLHPWFGTGVLASAFGINLIYNPKADPAVDLATMKHPEEIDALPMPVPGLSGAMPDLVRTIDYLALASVASATEFHVATTGDDANDGSAARPLKSIQSAAEKAMPGDTVTVHAGLYRERVNPPRGGESDARRITYQAAPGEKVIITGAEPVKGWEKVGNDTWKTVLPNSYFGDFNPFSDRIHGEWCSSGPLQGTVYLDGDWFDGTVSKAEVLKPAGAKRFWHVEVGGTTIAATTPAQPHLFALRNLRIGDQALPIESFTAIKPGSEVRTTTSADGSGPCLGWTRAEDWIAFAKVDLGKPQTLSFDAGALGNGGIIEFYSDLGTPEARRLGSVTIPHTGGWQEWQRFSASLGASSLGGERTLSLLFKAGTASRIPGTDTTLWAQFKGVNPNEANVESNVRQSVFYPSKPGVNYITVRGFELRHAATPWAGAMSEQIGLIGTHWSKGWIIESNYIHHSMCTGVTLGRYELPKNDFPPATAPGFVKSIVLALRDGWSKEKIGSHIVRNNRISHCEKNGIHGSLGACFSEVSGNDIHDISVRGWVSGDDRAGIKFLGGIDVVISGNHIYRCGGAAGIWLDWMAQGAQVTGNLIHDNTTQDIFCEMQHGPILIANNLFLSHRHSFEFNSQGIAVAHNLISGGMVNYRSDKRATPFHGAHTTELASIYPSAQGDSGDDRFYNNLFVAPGNLHVFDNSVLPCYAAGNVFTKGSQPSKFDINALLKPDFDTGVKLTEEPDGWYLTITEDKSWRDKARRQSVTTALLGKAKVSDCAYENADGSLVKVGTDYFGKPRDPGNPFPGPFEISKSGTRTIKVWPKP
jgi:alpha-L-arabinofuranosidase